VDVGDLAAELAGLDPVAGEAALGAVSAGEVLAIAGPQREALALRIARRARERALDAAGGRVSLEAIVVDRTGAVLAHAKGW
jgi:hypothetical protein